MESKQDELHILEKEAMKIETELNSFASIQSIDSSFLSYNTGKNLRKKSHATMLDAEESLY